MTTEILVLGSGCANCRRLAANAEEAVAALGLDAHVEEVHEIDRIMAYGVLQTPALVVDDEVVSVGRVPSAEQLRVLLASR
jgi:small redox-active disulfide protein 2